MRVSQLSVVQRVVLSIALPSVALILLWPTHWIKRVGLVIDGKRDDLVYAEYLRDQYWFWAAAVAVIAAWICLLWAPRKVKAPVATAPTHPEASLLP